MNKDRGQASSTNTTSEETPLLQAQQQQPVKQENIKPDIQQQHGKEEKGQVQSQVPFPTGAEGRPRQQGLHYGVHHGNIDQRQLQQGLQLGQLNNPSGTSQDQPLLQSASASESDDNARAGSGLHGQSPFDGQFGLYGEHGISRKSGVVGESFYPGQHGFSGGVGTGQSPFQPQPQSQPSSDLQHEPHLQFHQQQQQPGYSAEAHAYSVQGQQSAQGTDETHQVLQGEEVQRRYQHHQGDTNYEPGYLHPEHQQQQHWQSGNQGNVGERGEPCVGQSSITRLDPKIVGKDYEDSPGCDLNMKGNMASGTCAGCGCVPTNCQCKK